MPTLVLDPQPVEMAALIQQRHRLGQDRLDEVWAGVLHMNPAPAGGHGKVEQQLAVVLAPLAARAGLTSTGQFNLGDGPEDYRVPDIGLHRDWQNEIFYATAALVIEIVSPGDESYKKFDFYATHRVEEVIVIDLQDRRVHWFGLSGDRYESLQRSRLIDLAADELEQQLDWP